MHLSQAGAYKMDLRSFVGMLKGCNLINEKLTEREARFVFLHCNEDDEGMGDEEPDQHTTADTALKISYDEFTEAIVRTALGLHLLLLLLLPGFIPPGTSISYISMRSSHPYKWHISVGAARTKCKS